VGLGHGDHLSECPPWSILHPDTGWVTAIPWLVASVFPVASVIRLRIVLAKTLIQE